MKNQLNEKPKAQLIVHIGVFIPHQNGKTGDFCEAQALERKIMALGEGQDKKTLPDGFIAEIESVLGQLAELGRDHVPVEPKSKPDQKLQIPEGQGFIPDSKSVKNPTMQLFAVGPDGQSRAVGKPVEIKPDIKV